MPIVMGKDTIKLNMPIVLGILFIFRPINISYMKPKEISPDHQVLMIEIGRRIKELRKAKQLSYIELATQIGISRNTYNQLELGIINFQFGTLLAVLKYHGISLSEFFKDL
jgi:DNA-binding XRE family transcriptional regulator